MQIITVLSLCANGTNWINTYVIPAGTDSDTTAKIVGAAETDFANEAKKLGVNEKDMAYWIHLGMYNRGEESVVIEWTTPKEISK